jgi:hypothetical protein
LPLFFFFYFSFIRHTVNDVKLTRNWFLMKPISFHIHSSSSSLTDSAKFYVEGNKENLEIITTFDERNLAQWNNETTYMKSKQGRWLQFIHFHCVIWSLNKHKLQLIPFLIQNPNFLPFYCLINNRTIECDVYDEHRATINHDDAQRPSSLWENWTMNEQYP